MLSDENAARLTVEAALAKDIADLERQARPRDWMLRDRVDRLQRELTDLSERVRLSDVADAFLRGEHPIAAGDYFLLDHGTPTKLLSISDEGKWTYFDGRQVIEPFRVPRPDQYERLYTRAEVAEMVAKRTSSELRVLRQMRDAVVQFRLDWQSGDLGPSDVEPILDRILARTEVP